MAEEVIKKMTIRQTLVRTLVKIGIGLIDILILGIALVYIYLAATPLEDIGLITVDIGMILLTVIILYVVVVGFVSLCLTYMREDNSLAKWTKGFISTVVIMALFNLFIFPIMWLLGYSLSADVQLTLMVAAIARMLSKIFLRRYFGAYLV